MAAALGLEWSADRTELLSRLWADGLSASRIAAKIGGITRNSVISKANRIGLQARKEPNERLTPEEAHRRKVERDRRRRERHRNPAMPRRKPGPPKCAIHPNPRRKKVAGGPPPNKRAQSEPVVMLPSLRLTLMQLTDNTCKYPDGALHEKASTFCGNKTVSLSRPYCDHHHQIMYRPWQPRADRLPFLAEAV